MNEKQKEGMRKLLESKIEKVSEKNSKELEAAIERLGIKQFRPIVLPHIKCSKEKIIADSLEMLLAMERGEMEDVTHKLEEFLE